MEWLNYHHLRYFWTVAKEGGLARAANLSKKQRSDIAKKAAQKRWGTRAKPAKSSRKKHSP